MTRARIEALHREAADLIRDGLCTDHIDREIEALEAANDPLPIAHNDSGEGEVA